MNTKKTLFRLLAVLCVLLCGCSQAPQEPADPLAALTPYTHSLGVSLRMEGTFTETAVSGILGGYEGETANVRFAEELFQSLENLGMDPAMTTEEYAQLLADTYGLEVAPATDEYGSVYLRYSEDISGVPVAYFAFFTKGPAAFWTTTFMCTEEVTAELEDDFHLWASTIQVPDEAVTEPYVPEPQREELTDEERTDLTNTMEKLQPADWLGRSFTAAELTDEELLRIAYAVWGGRFSGFSAMGSEWFIERVTDRYFGRADVTPADFTCSCGVPLAVYNAAEDQFDWGTDAHDHTAHVCEPLNLYQDAWKQDGVCYLTMYKLFPDLNENAGGTLAFYGTFADAQSRTNALFTAADETGFSAALDTLDASVLPLYTCTFVLREDGYYQLKEYTIG